MTAPEKFKYVMKEYKDKALKLSSGKPVKSIKQALAIAFSEARKITPSFSKKAEGGFISARDFQKDLNSIAKELYEKTFGKLLPKEQEKVILKALASQPIGVEDTMGIEDVAYADGGGIQLQEWEALGDNGKVLGKVHTPNMANSSKMRKSAQRKANAKWFNSLGSIKLKKKGLVKMAKGGDLDVEIEYLNEKTNEYDYIDVELDIDYSVDNDSFSWEQGSQRGTEKYPDYIQIESIKWDKTKYTDEQNKEIQKYTDDVKSITQDLTEKLDSEYNDSFDGGYADGGVLDDVVHNDKRIEIAQKRLNERFPDARLEVFSFIEGEFVDIVYDSRAGEQIAYGISRELDKENKNLTSFHTDEGGDEYMWVNYEALIKLLDRRPKFYADGGEIFEYKVKQYSKNHTIKELSEIQDKLLKTKNKSKAQQENLMAISTAIGVKRNPDFYKDKMSKGASTYAEGGGVEDELEQAHLRSIKHNGSKVIELGVERTNDYIESITTKGRNGMNYLYTEITDGTPTNEWSFRWDDDAEGGGVYSFKKGDKIKLKPSVALKSYQDRGISNPTFIFIKYSKKSNEKEYSHIVAIRGGEYEDILIEDAIPYYAEGGAILEVEGGHIDLSPKEKSKIYRWIETSPIFTEPIESNEWNFFTDNFEENLSKKFGKTKEQSKSIIKGWEISRGYSKAKGGSTYAEGGEVFTEGIGDYPARLLNVKYKGLLRFAEKVDTGGKSKEDYAKQKTLEWAKGLDEMEKEDETLYDITTGKAVGTEQEIEARNELYAEGGEVEVDLKRIKKKYPKAKVSYYYAKNDNGKPYVVTAKEKGKIVYSSYKQPYAKGGEVIGKSHAKGGKIDQSKLRNVTWGDIDYKDYPDFSDAYIESAQYEDESGKVRNLTTEEIESIDDNYQGDKLDDIIQSSIMQAGGEVPDDYAMYSKGGNKAVLQLVKRIIKKIKGKTKVTQKGLNTEIKAELKKISKKYPEVNDTEPEIQIQYTINPFLKSEGYNWGTDRYEWEKGGEVDTTIAETILQQLGGMGKLRMMTGANRFGALKNGVKFRIPYPKTNVITITLNGRDYYDMEIGRLRAGKYNIVEEFKDVPYDYLQRNFEQATGLYLRFAKGGKTQATMKKGGRVLVGRFDEKQLKNKEDKKALAKAEKESGLTYTDTKIIKKGGKMFLEVYLIPNEEYYNSTKFAKGGKTQATMKKGGDIPSASTIQGDGDFIEDYPVDEGYNSNAGDAEVYEYKGKKYQVTTWNDRAEEHEPDSTTVSLIEYAKGGDTSTWWTTEDFYEQLAVYVQGGGTIYQGTSMHEATESASSYLEKHPKAEVTIMDEKYGDEYDLGGNQIESDDDYAKGGEMERWREAGKSTRKLKEKMKKEAERIKRWRKNMREKQKSKNFNPAHDGFYDLPEADKMRLVKEYDSDHDRCKEMDEFFYADGSKYKEPKNRTLEETMEQFGLGDNFADFVEGDLPFYGHGGDLGVHQANMTEYEYHEVYAMRKLIDFIVTGGGEVEDIIAKVWGEATPFSLHTQQEWEQLKGMERDKVWMRNGSVARWIYGLTPEVQNDFLKWITRNYETEKFDCGGAVKADGGKITANKFKQIVKDAKDYLSTYPYIWGKGGKNYVPVEGWQYVGRLLGYSAKVVEVNSIEGQGWQAKAEIVNDKGNIVCSGFGLATKQEEKWAGENEQPLHDFAQTKAVARAFANCIGDIMKASGYQRTPAEEMYRIKGKSSKKRPAQSTTITGIPSGSAITTKQWEKEQGEFEKEWAEKFTSPDEKKKEGKNKSKTEARIMRDIATARDSGDLLVKEMSLITDAENAGLDVAKIRDEIQLRQAELHQPFNKQPLAPKVTKKVIAKKPKAKAKKK